MQADGSDAGSVAATPPQEQITMLLNMQDFYDKVGQDRANLCCVLVTSTLCRQCGIRRIPYPKAPSRNADEADDDGGEDDEEENGGLAEDGEGEDGDHNAHGTVGGTFYRDFETHLVRKASTAAQRRHVRFFHACACAEEETCIDFLISADPAYRMLNQKLTAQDVARLHKKAHCQLHELLIFLEVRSTPYMRFYLAGQPVRYSMMSSAAAVGGASAAPVSGLSETNDVIVATGANRVKWARVLENAVVVRNAVMREYDAEEREKSRQAHAAARQLAREARKRQEAAEDDDDE